MARPKSADKRSAIIAAAVQTIAEQGMVASTYAIAKSAGVAEGTLFTYFPTKDELVNTTYLELKSEMQAAMLANDSSDRSPRQRAQELWNRYVEWGMAVPARRRAMSQFALSDRITDENKAADRVVFAGFSVMLKASTEGGALRQQSEAFVLAILRSFAETTMDFMEQEPEKADSYRDSGFEAFWKAIT